MEGKIHLAVEHKEYFDAGGKNPAIDAEGNGCRELDQHQCGLFIKTKQ